MKKIVKIENLDCANCAAKLERALNKIDGVNAISINFMAMKMSVDCADDRYAAVAEEIKAVTKKVEPDCVYKGL